MFPSGAAQSAMPAKKESGGGSHFRLTNGSPTSMPQYWSCEDVFFSSGRGHVHLHMNVHVYNPQIWNCRKLQFNDIYGIKYGKNFINWYNSYVVLFAFYLQLLSHHLFGQIIATQKQKVANLKGNSMKFQGDSSARPCLVAPCQSPGIATAIDAVLSGSRSGSGEPAGGSLESLKVENG